MRASLLALVRCPACGGEIEIARGRARQPEIWEGDLRCVACRAVYPVKRGIPHLYVDDARWAPKAQEALGWVNYHKELGFYIQPEDAIDLKIPYCPEEPWITVAKSFDMAMEELASFLSPGMVVLDLGAGRGWAAKQFALRGCHAVALDIAPDENVGLGRAWALMKHAGVHFDPIIADGERLPLLPDSFDLVFCAATLHHTSDLPLLMKNIQRVLKPGGMLCAISEPCIAVNEKAERVLARVAGAELKHGINEQRPNLLEYWAAVNGAGFGETSFIWPPGYRLSLPELTDCAKNWGAIQPAWPEYGWRANLALWRLYSYHRLALLPLHSLASDLLNVKDARQSLMRSILLWSNGEVQIFARRRGAS